MNLHSKRVLQHVLRSLGYELRRVPVPMPDVPERREPPSPMFGVLTSGKYEVDIFQYADSQASATSGFRQKLEQRAYQLTSHSCPICGHAHFDPVAESKEGFRWGICSTCGLLQLYVRFRQEDQNAFYTSGEYQAVCMGNLDDRTHFELEHRVMGAYFLEMFQQLGMRLDSLGVLEIGCGSGGILLAMKEAGVSLVKGYDIDQHRVAYGKPKVPEIEVGDAMQAGMALDGQFNAILISNILEHLYDPQAFMSSVADLIGPAERHVFIDVPNLEYCYAYSDVSFAKFLHIGHLWYFNAISLERLLNQAGFAVEFVLPRESAFTVVCKKAPAPSKTGTTPIGTRFPRSTMQATNAIRIASDSGVNAWRTASSRPGPSPEVVRRPRLCLHWVHLLRNARPRAC